MPPSSLLLVSATAALAAAFQLPAVRPIAARNSVGISMGLKVGDEFPATALRNLGVKGKPAILFFYGADDAPSCSKQLKSFDLELPGLKSRGVAIVGIRNDKGAKGSDVGFPLAIDEGDKLRNLIGIKKDLGLLGGRETYVVDSSGKVISVYNNQFNTEAHVTTALTALNDLPQSVQMMDFRQIAGVFGINLY